MAAPSARACAWPPRLAAPDRFDLSECFELIVLLPVPLLLATLMGAAQMYAFRRRLRDGRIQKQTRSVRSEKVGKIKAALFGVCAVHALASAALAGVQIRTSPYPFIHYALLFSTYTVFSHLTITNHRLSRTSSTPILVFYPFYVFAAALRIRTLVVTGALSLALKHTGAGRVVLAREALWLASVGVAAVEFVLELYSPERKWRPWGRGKIALDEDVDEDSGAISEDGEKESPVVTANIYERLTFSWLTPLLSLGTRKYLGEEDMWSLPPGDSAEALSDRLANAWERQLSLVASGKRKKPSLKLALARAYGLPYFIAGVFKAMYDCLNFAQPQLLRLLLAYVSSYGTRNQWPAPAGFGVAILMFISANVATALLHQYFDRCFSTIMRVKSGLVSLIYRKSLRLGNGEKTGRSSGDIVNLQSVDAVRIADLGQFGHIAWSGPFQIIIAFVSLYNLVGWQAFTGVAIMAVSLPINTLIAKQQKKLQRELMGIKDTRTRLMNEILNNIKSIKLYGWEKAFAGYVLDTRNGKELKQLRSIGLVQALSNFFWQSIPFFVSFATFATFVATSDRPLTSEIIFPALSLFQLLSFPMAVFSNVINSIIEALVSVQRIETFLNAEELDYAARTVIDPKDDPEGEPQAGDVVVEVKGGEFRWLHDSVEPILQDIDLTVKKGELVSVIGRVGDGKSSLISALLGEMTRSDGSVKLRGSIAYFSQNAWILSATVKENILFGHRFDPVFYDKVLDACALRSDLAVLPQGHMTEVGEKGVSLSGGQKARICLARACYARADIYLLDDPLSAVDAHVGRHVFDNVIGPDGLLHNKARVLCTNAVNFLPQSDQIIMLRRGIILERAAYADAMENPASELYKLITGLGKQAAKADDGSGASTSTAVDDVVQEEHDDADYDEPELAENADLVKPTVDRRLSVATLRRASAVSIGEAKREALRDLRESAKPKEHTERGNVKREVYKEYISAASTTGVVIFLLALVTSQAASILGNYVLRGWARQNQQTGENSNVAAYLITYGVVGVGASALNVVAILVLKLYCALRSSRKLHDASFLALMRSPLSFFELTPTGRILNLFSRDIFVVDEVLVMALSQFVRTAINVCGVIVIIGLGARLVLVVFVPLAFIYRIVMRYYLATSRELKRLDAVSRSPIFSYFGETLSGLAVIRAFGQTARFRANNEARVDRNQACFVPAVTINRWLAVRLEFLGSCLMFSTALVSVAALSYSNNVDSGLVGLLMTYTISVTGALNWLVRSASEVEQNIVSVERVIGYAKLPSEAAEDVPERKPPASWPERGDIEFDHFSMRYRPELPLCLDDVSVKITGGERVGVVGRTGAGKSSLTLALFRILEAAAGRILVDGVDIAQIGLRDLRAVVSIIPQDPQLFEGSLRTNIDPTHAASDADIWTALEQAYLKDHVMAAMGGTLDAEIAEGGSNMSAGQRQLVCFARALLRKTRILVLDEATSSIDLETDDAVQQILRGSDFAGVTTITIAHRINTIMDSDKVLVMAQGRVAEFDTPSELLTRPESVFYSLVKEAGLLGDAAGAGPGAGGAQIAKAGADA
ncbi:hypothetical protein Q5752_001282 [Cryptotrichosporon argae]